ncbi:GNAT family N-acetyltransferase [Amycolatopsis sp. NPDC059021]|uniref:GNAT family N-acetyltransferase n=1 Tax=Amycolatopsis sp. NPDC059021 TaxID=3346704 RepID=UPI00366D386A
MTDFEVRPVADDERRDSMAVLMQSLHDKPLTDEGWANIDSAWQAEGSFAAFDGDVPVGLAHSFETVLAIPGGRAIEVGAVDGIGVRADWTRRGVHTALQQAQLRYFAEQGKAIACLHASETTIYGRFGYGVATLNRTFRIEHPAARLRDGVSTGGHVRFLSPEEAVKQGPDVYRRAGLTRPGMVARPDSWWTLVFNENAGPKGKWRTAVHNGPDGADGFVAYETIDLGTLEDPEKGALLRVADMHAATPEAETALWGFLLSVDLVSAIHVRDRPVDDAIPLLLNDPRHARTLAIEDDLWVRVIDVEAALAARAYGDAEPVVLEVTDNQLADNNGRYEVGPGGVRRSGKAAGLRLGVDVLGMLYLGEWRPTDLARAGRIEVLDGKALTRADSLFPTAVHPWCGTHF